MKFFGQKSFAKNSMLFIIISFFSRAIPFFLLPILARYLSTSEFGLINNLMAFCGILITFISFSSPSFIGLIFFKVNEKIFSSHLINSFLISSLVLFASLLFSTKIATFLGIDSLYVILTIFYCFFTAILEISNALLKAQRNILGFSIVEFSRTLLNLLFTTLFIIIFNMSLYGRIWALFLSGLISFFVSIYLIRKFINFDFTINKRLLFSNLAFSIPLLPHAFSSWIINASDRFFITSMVGLEENAQYSFSYQIASIITVIGLSINYAWQPFLYEKLKIFEYKNVFKKYFTLILFISLISFLLYLFSPLIAEIIGKDKYQSSLKFSGILIIGASLNVFEMFLISFIFYFGKNKLLIFSTLSGALLNIGLNLFLIPLYKGEGAAIATVSANILTFLITSTIVLLLFKNLKN